MRLCYVHIDSEYPSSQFYLYLLGFLPLSLLGLTLTAILIFFWVLFACVSMSICILLSLLCP